VGVGVTANEQSEGASEGAKPPMRSGATRCLGRQDKDETKNMLAVVVKTTGGERSDGGGSNPLTPTKNQRGQE
jgi:hypothetical protein